jgi:hypothetical protein
MNTIRITLFPFIFGLAAARARLSRAAARDPALASNSEPARDARGELVLDLEQHGPRAR